MTTQVQIGRNRSHLVYLRMIASRFASSLGMARKDLDDVVRAITDIWQLSCKSAPAEESKLLVDLTPSGSHLMVEIKGFSSNFESAHKGLASICRFMDSVEVTVENGEDVIRLTKYVRKPENMSSILSQNLSAVRTSGLQS